MNNKPNLKRLEQNNENSTAPMKDIISRLVLVYLQKWSTRVNWFDFYKSKCNMPVKCVNLILYCIHRNVVQGKGGDGPHVFYDSK